MKETSKQMTQLLRIWYENENHLWSGGEFFFHDSGVGSVFIDAQTPVVMARVTLWDSGNCDLEVIDAQDGKQMYWFNTSFNNWSDAHKSIKEFYASVEVNC